MAYSDYGGYGYKNGIRVEERSDFTVTPDGKGFESCGLWPGFTAIMQGKSKEEIAQLREYPNGHVVLGDGPVFVCLYKQSTTMIYNGMDRLDSTKLLVNKQAGATESWMDDKDVTHNYINTDFFLENNEPCVLEFEGNKITIWYEETDNYYQYVKLEQPDGNIWTGFSGYGIGAGLEDSEYHNYNTEVNVERLFELTCP